MAEMKVEMMRKLEVVESWKDAGGSRSGRGEGDRVKNGGGLGEVMEEGWWWLWWWRRWRKK